MGTNFAAEEGSLGPLQGKKEALMVRREVSRKVGGELGHLQQSELFRSGRILTWQGDNERGREGKCRSEGKYTHMPGERVRQRDRENVHMS